MQCLVGLQALSPGVPEGGARAGRREGKEGGGSRGKCIHLTQPATPQDGCIVAVHLNDPLPPPRLTPTMTPRIRGPLAALARRAGAAGAVALRPAFGVAPPVASRTAQVTRVARAVHTAPRTNRGGFHSTAAAAAAAVTGAVATAVFCDGQDTKEPATGIAFENTVGDATLRGVGCRYKFGLVKVRAGSSTTNAHQKTDLVSQSPPFFFFVRDAGPEVYAVGLYSEEAAPMRGAGTDEAICRTILQSPRGKAVVLKMACGLDSKSLVGALEDAFKPRLSKPGRRAVALHSLVDAGGSRPTLYTSSFQPAKSDDAHLCPCLMCLPRVRTRPFHERLDRIPRLHPAADRIPVRRGR